MEVLTKILQQGTEFDTLAETVLADRLRLVELSMARVTEGRAHSHGSGQCGSLFSVGKFIELRGEEQCLAENRCQNSFNELFLN